MNQISVTEAAKMSGLSVVVMRKYCREGRFSCDKLGPRFWAINEASFLEWLRVPRRAGRKKRK